jgi:hypothetical protein
MDCGGGILEVAMKIKSNTSDPFRSSRPGQKKRRDIESFIFTCKAVKLLQYQKKRRAHRWIKVFLEKVLSELDRSHFRKDIQPNCRIRISLKCKLLAPSTAVSGRILDI